MRQTNNLYLLGSFILLALLLVVWLLTDNGYRVNVNVSLFRVKDLNEIGRVELQRQANTIRLHYNGVKWMLNDSLDADPQMVQVLFAALLQAEPKRPVAQRLRDSIHRQMRDHGVFVRLYDGEAIQKQFYVSGNEQRQETYFLLEGDTQPYVMTIPGYRVYLAGIFEMKVSEWREKRLFNFQWQNFKSLQATFPFKGANNFRISFQKNYFGLEGAPEADTSRVNDYLDAVSLLRAYRFVEKGESAYIDSLIKTTPAYWIEVTDIANRSYGLNVFGALPGQPLVVGSLPGGTAVLLAREDEGKINRTRSYFILRGR
jgi:hypothetical protein